MRTTVCELPHDPASLAATWAALCRHVTEERSELVLLPEFAMIEPLWERETFDAVRWVEAEALSEAWLALLPELGAARVVGARPVSADGRRFNQGFLWTRRDGMRGLRSKYYMPAEPGAWETRWFDRGDATFPVYRDGPLAFGLNICTELWALESYAGYAAGGAQVILAPRATEAATFARWLAAGVVAAIRSGGFCLSSNRVDPSGATGGVGWIIAPDGEVLATTSAETPFVTRDLDLDRSVAARSRYPGYVFSGEPAGPGAA